MRVTALVTLLCGAVLGLVGMLAGAGTASAQGSRAITQALQDDKIHIIGHMIDQRVKPPKPVPGVKISVFNHQGKQIGSAVSDKTGTFSGALPGTGFDVVGHKFTVRIDTKTLPPGAALRNPKQVSLTIDIITSEDQTVTFPIAAAPKT